MPAPAARSPLAVDLPALPPLAGVRLAAAAAGIRYQGRTDLVMAELAAGTVAAGVFTRNQCPGAPIDWDRAALAGGRARALVVNAGNANVFTGAAGLAACRATAEAAAALVGCRARQVFVASTGVIGETLPHARITAALPALHAALRAEGWEDAARGIMTTDTFPKAATRTASIGGTEVRISGIAKGSGMIAPDMATMLCFVFTDAAIPAEPLQAMLSRGVRHSFNCITVDSDTSTSDSVLLFATGQARHARVAAGDRAMLRGFRDALDAVLLDFALQVVRDGEGARKLVRIEVCGAVSGKSARRVALAVANSPLVKTAIAGEDANWGRIVMAVGKAGEPADRDRLSVAVGGVWMARAGGVVAGYDEAPVVAHMRGDEVSITVGSGPRARPRDGLDLRPDARLYRHQRKLPKLTARCMSSGQVDGGGQPARAGTTGGGCVDDMTPDLTSEAFARAEARGEARLRGPRAESALYDAARNRVIVRLTTGVEISFAPDDAQGLQHASGDDLATIEMDAFGLGIHVPAPDADLSVPALLEGVVRSKTWMAARLGAAGGRCRTAAKAAASRENGKRGGRPRKVAAKQA